MCVPPIMRCCCLHFFFISFLLPCCLLDPIVVLRLDMIKPFFSVVSGKCFFAFDMFERCVGREMRKRERERGLMNLSHILHDKNPIIRQEEE
jgi:hypothetical protein